MSHEQADHDQFDQPLTQYLTGLRVARILRAHPPPLSVHDPFMMSYDLHVQAQLAEAGGRVQAKFQSTRTSCWRCAVPKRTPPPFWLLALIHLWCLSTSYRLDEHFRRIALTACTEARREECGDEVAVFFLTLSQRLLIGC